MTVCLKAGLITNSWTWLTHCSIWGSIGLWFLFMFSYRYSVCLYIPIQLVHTRSIILQSHLATRKGWSCFRWNASHGIYKPSFLAWSDTDTSYIPASWRVDQSVSFFIPNVVETNIKICLVMARFDPNDLEKCTKYTFQVSVLPPIVAELKECFAIAHFKISSQKLFSKLLKSRH